MTLSLLSAVLILWGGVDVLPAVEPLVPVQLSDQTDASGTTWSFHANGYLQQCNQAPFHYALCPQSADPNPQSGGQRNFDSDPPRGTRDGKTYVFSGAYQGVQLVRWFTLIPELSALRCIDQLVNPGSKPVDVTLQLSTRYHIHMRGILSDLGNTVTGTLGARESGILVQSGHPGMPGDLYWIDKRTRKLLRRIEHDGSRTNFHFQVRIPARSSRSIVMGMAFAPAGASGAGVSNYFNPFRDRKFMAHIPPALRSSLGGYVSLNWQDLNGLEELNTVLGFDRGSQDILELGKGARLVGEAHWEGMVLGTQHGRIPVKPDALAGMVGARLPGGRCRVFFRDGRIAAGTLECGLFRFQTLGGISVEVPPASVERLGMRLESADSERVDDVTAFLETGGGERFALRGAGVDTLEILTPWGGIRQSLAGLLAIHATEDELGVPAWKLSREDGSQFLGLPQTPLLRLETLSFGRLELPSGQLLRMVKLRPAVSTPDTEAEFAGVRLQGACQWAGSLRADELMIHTGEACVRLPGKSIRRLSRRDPESGMESVEGLSFLAECWDGSRLVGEISPEIMNFESGGDVLRLPLADITELVRLEPSLPEEVRARIAVWIEKLGDASWKTREKASRSLADFGPAARPQLQEVADRTRDAEIRYRAQEILRRLKD